MTEASMKSEQTFVENEFGTVTSRRVVYFRKKGWFSGGSREDIPLQHVTSVRLETSRNLMGGVLLLFVGLLIMAAGSGMAIIGFFLMALAVLLLWGSPAVVVNTAGRDLNASKGLPWKRPEANSFVEALRRQLFNKPSA